MDTYNDLEELEYQRFKRELQKLTHDEIIDKMWEFRNLIKEAKDSGLI